MTVSSGQAVATSGNATPAHWQELRSDGDIQFAPVEIPEIPPRDPTWLDNLLRWLGEQLAPLGKFLGQSWPVMRWVLLALLITLVLYLVVRMIDPELLRRRKRDDDDGAGQEWQPDQQAASALLADADRLASEGRFDEATHLLLQRSVTHIANARPDWVDPSSTARELAALPALSEAARGAFAIIAERVERSLFALRALNQADWEVAREAYAEFALVRFDGARI
ncbi:MAG: hypothetical protein EP350_03115 [Alphaproteobacteria bacterium]|nr:MAG: hypothetical protein EP350_03115 [Alphaproteobacteria bacterium]